MIHFIYNGEIICEISIEGSHEGEIKATKELLSDINKINIDDITIEIAKVEEKKWLNQKKCIICGKDFKGFGNNAEPITKGKCCDKCNKEIVIPTRCKKAFEIKRRK